MRKALGLVVNNLLYYCLYVPFLYLGGTYYKIKIKFTGEDVDEVINTLIVPRLVRLSIFISKVTDKIEGGSEHENKCIDAWKNIIFEKENLE